MSGGHQTDSCRPYGSLIYMSLRPGWFTQGQPEREKQRWEHVLRSSNCLQPCAQDRWLLFAREGGRITVAKCAHRSDLAGIKWGLSAFFV